MQKKMLLQQWTKIFIIIAIYISLSSLSFHTNCAQLHFDAVYGPVHAQWEQNGRPQSTALLLDVENARRAENTVSLHV